MKKLFALLFSFALAFALPTVAFADDDKDCKDFANWQEAQQYFESKGGSSTNNVDRLDNDHDGLACENLPGFDPSHQNPNDHKNDNSNSGNTGSGNNNSSNNNGSNGNNNNTGDNNNSNNSGSNNGGSNTNNGGKLPKTATSYPTGLLAGAVLLLMGAGLLMLKPLFGRK